MGKFGIEKNGYNKKEVNMFVEEVIVNTEKLIQKIDEQQRVINHYRELENSVKNAIIEAEKTSESIKEKATEDGKIIINDARENASNIVNEALIKAEQIEKDSEKVKQKIVGLKKNIEELLEKQKMILQEIELIGEKR